MSIFSKFALNKGMSPHVFAVYRHAVATIVVAPFALILDRPTIDQNLFYTGMKYTTATFTTAMANVLPAFAFLMAWIIRLEKVNFRKFHSWAKVFGTIVTVGGAMFMTLIKGPVLDLPWTNHNYHQESTSNSSVQSPIKGALMITIGCFSWAGFMAITLKSYPTELSLTALICLMGTIEGTIVALFLERGNAAVWSIHLDSKLLAAVYSGVICSGIGYYVSGVVMKDRGPVFVTAFNPLCMIIVAIMGSFLLSEIMYLGRVVGAIIIVVGLYLVLWGKSKDQNTQSPGSNIKELAASSYLHDQQMAKTSTKIGASNDRGSGADEFV
ncbi:WAT1-related protein [Citrus sinensis]|nr:WAT1-related protein [Citrus sinensis]